MKLGDFVQSGDWKGEKHVPVIELPEKPKAGEAFCVKLGVGNEIPHPNTAAHYIKWIKLYFIPNGGKFAVELGSLSFDAHGDSMDGAKTAPAFAEPFGCIRAKLSESGTLVAQSYCNIHGLWENSLPVDIG